jgi:hypothetical protein
MGSDRMTDLSLQAPNFQATVPGWQGGTCGFGGFAALCSAVQCSAHHHHLGPARRRGEHGWVNQALLCVPGRQSVGNFERYPSALSSLKEMVPC